MPVALAWCKATPSSASQAASTSCLGRGCEFAACMIYMLEAGKHGCARPSSTMQLCSLGKNSFLYHDQEWIINLPHYPLTLCIINHRANGKSWSAGPGWLLVLIVMIVDSRSGHEQLRRAISQVGCLHVVQFPSLPQRACIFHLGRLGTPPHMSGWHIEY